MYLWKHKWKKLRIFYLICALIGSGIGSIQSSSRAIVACLADGDKSGEAFGFWGVFARVASLLGLSFGFVSDFASRNAALVVLLGYFIIGASLLRYGKKDDVGIGGIGKPSQN